MIIRIEFGQLIKPDDQVLGNSPIAVFFLNYRHVIQLIICFDNEVNKMTYKESCL